MRSIFDRRIGRRQLVQAVREACESRLSYLNQLIQEDKQMLGSVGFSSDRDEKSFELEFWRRTEQYRLKEKNDLNRLSEWVEGAEIVTLIFRGRDEVWIFKGADDDEIADNPTVLEMAVNQLSKSTDKKIEIYLISSDCQVKRQYDQQVNGKNKSVKVLGEDAQVVYLK